MHLSIIHMAVKVPVDVVADVLVAWMPWRCAGRCNATTSGEGCGDNEVFLGRVVVVVCSYQKVKHPGQGLQSSLDTAGIKLKPKAEGVFCKPPPRIGSIENLHKS